MSCNRPAYPNGFRDGMGNFIGLLINGTDESVGVINMATQPDDYAPTFSDFAPDDTFRICFETAGIIEVQLADGTNFTITAVQVDAYLGRWYEANIKKVYKNGTTATFSVGW